MNGRLSDEDLAFVAAALPAFVSEAQEHIDLIEQHLLQLEAEPQDAELHNALFRSAHTIKGSAGVFGLDHIVDFTHHVETLLDHLRNGQIAFSPAIGSLLLRCNDEIRLMVNGVSDAAADDSSAESRRSALIESVKALVAAMPSDQEGKLADTGSPAGAGADPGSSQVRDWCVLARFGGDCYRNGMDPLAVLNYLGAMGDSPVSRCDLSRIPTLDQLDPETCYWSVGTQIRGDLDRERIESAFLFVHEDCEIDIVQSGEIARLREHAVIAPQAQQLARLLLDCGAITTPEADTPDLAVVVPPDSEHTTSAPAVLSSTPAPKAPAGARPRSAEAAAPADENRLIRVQADRLDAVINLIGELVVAGAGASMLARQSRNAAMIEANVQITRLIEDIRSQTLQLRMVPIGDTFARFRRVVRDTAAELGKEVTFEIVGGDTELDKSMVERITDPLMHLVRNALDHGLETPEARIAACKPAQGRLTMAAFHEGGSVVIRISDDGGGIRRQKVLQRAWERGLLEDGFVPPDEDIVKLIFEPGFSTADKVTNLSGRGVGMDVVRSNILALRGSIQATSVEGEGSVMEIHLPLTLAIIDGFLVGAGASRFIFPLDAVVEVIETGQAVSRRDERGRNCVELRGRLLPVLDLCSTYGLVSERGDHTSTVVITSEGRQFGVVVDTLYGQHQTVIKPLSKLFRSLRGISGSSILGNGEVALIIDVASLGALAASEGSRLRPEPASGVHRASSLS